MNILVPTGLGLVILSYLLTAGLYQFAGRARIVVVPDARSLHSEVTPGGGGLTIVVVTLGGIGISLPIYSDLPAATLGIYLGCSFALAAVSLMDDFKTVSSALRLLVHTIISLVMILHVGYLRVVTLPGVVSLDIGLMGAMVTLIWIVGLTNVYNFMDGIDGIAGSHGFLTAVSWFAVGYALDSRVAMLMGWLLAGSSLGFLIHNWPPARIFMGDVGSTFLGFSWAVVPFMVASDFGSGSEWRFVVFSVILTWPFLFDGSFTFLRRLFRKENVFTAHRSHLYQRLVLSGYSHQTVSLIYTVFTLCGMLLGFLWMFGMSIRLESIAVALVLLACGLWGITINRERRCAKSSRY